MEGVILSKTVLLTATARDKFIPTKVTPNRRHLDISGTAPSS